MSENKAESADSRRKGVSTKSGVFYGRKYFRSWPALRAVPSPRRHARARVEAASVPPSVQQRLRRRTEGSVCGLVDSRLRCSRQDLANVVRFSTIYRDALGGAAPGEYLSTTACEMFSGAGGSSRFFFFTFPAGLPRGWTSPEPLRYDREAFQRDHPKMFSKARLFARIFIVTRRASYPCCRCFPELVGWSWASPSSSPSKLPAWQFSRRFIYPVMMAGEFGLF